MAHAPEKRAIVRAAYVHERLPIEEAATKADVSERTASRWKADAREENDDWDRARAAKHMVGEGFQSVIQAVLEDFVEMYQGTLKSVRETPDLPPLTKAEDMSRLADAFTKTMAAAGKAAPELSRLAIANEVLRLQGEYVKKFFPRHGHAFVEVLGPFAEALAQHFG
jgi:hypothetical protein